MHRSILLALAAGALLAAGPVQATTIVDPVGDFLTDTYTGPHNADLDIVRASVVFDGTAFRLTSTSDGAIGATPGSLFVWGINRGGGTARLELGSPGIGPTVLWDAVAVLFPDGTARVASFPAAGPPTITPLTGAVTVNGDTISGLFPLALLPSRGFAAEDYTFTLWSRARVNPAADGTNAEIADFAPNIGGVHASAPEPSAWALSILGFAMLGGLVRRRRAAA
jgi:MYXO-CTERM domain-containing protein